MITPPLSDVSSGDDEGSVDGVYDNALAHTMSSSLSKEIQDVREIYDGHMMHSETNDPYLADDNNNVEQDGNNQHQQRLRD